MDRCTMCLMQKPDVAAVEGVLMPLQICDKCAQRLLDAIAERVALRNAEMEVWND